LHLSLSKENSEYGDDEIWLAERTRNGIARLYF